MIAPRKIIIAGGGLSGLITAICLSRQNFDCTLIEKKIYPFHRVCGEYISNETTSFLKREGLYPGKFNPPQINQLLLSSSNGKSAHADLKGGGFGISRYVFDNFLYEIAEKSGVKFLLQTEIDSISFIDKTFKVSIQGKELEADFVVGAFGKRSKLDIQLSRNFIKKRSPYVGIKYHARTNHPGHIIALHNFSGGYCGVSNIEDGKTNICYLIHRDYVKRAGSIEAVEKTILFKNPFLKELFNEAEFLFEKPEVINEISFETKEPVWNHILMTGDAAGMITPLCGNGMAMAIHSAKILSDLIIQYGNDNYASGVLENAYRNQWRNNFSKRLWIGRQLQTKLFGTEWGSSIAVNLAIHSKRVTDILIKGTHGKSF